VASASGSEGGRRAAERHAAAHDPDAAAARHRVAAAARRLAEKGLVIGTAGNVSERAGGVVAITPTGAHLETITAEQIAVVDLDGEQLGGELEPTSELGLHLGVYRRYQAGAVVHTHSTMATALSCVLDELPVVHYQMLLLGGPVRVARYATFGSAELADATLDALDRRAAALMANHGAIVHGPDLDWAVEQSLLLEWACTVYWHASAIDAPRALDDEERMAVIEAAVRRGYGATREREGNNA
jgi:L-fuculose-phosphate aldolase